MSNIRKDYIVNVLMLRAVTWLQSALNVKRVSGNMVLTGTTCGNSPGVGIPESHRTTGVASADFVVYVTAVPMASNTSSTVAWAMSCRRDQDTRPVVGHINFVPSRLTNAIMRNAVQQDEDVATAIHELCHALGFAAPYFALRGYVDLNGMLIAGGTRSQTDSLLGKTTNKMTTPRVLREAQSHFACTTLDGVEIEDQGGSGTAGSHWEKRIFGSEFLVGVSSSVKSYFSRVTLAYFEDTGYYTANYDVADTRFFGYHAGCDFVQKKCNDAANSARTEHCFDADSTNTYCTEDLLGRGVCSVSQYSSLLPANMQYFSDPTLGSTAQVSDFCPSVQAYSNRVCVDSALRDSEDVFGQSFGKKSRCFSSTIMKRGYSNPYSGKQTRCHAYQCTSIGTLQIVVGGAALSCPSDGSAGNAVMSDLPLSYTGSVVCPAAIEICTPATSAPSATVAVTPSPLPAGQTYPPTAAPATEEPTLAPTCAGRTACADTVGNIIPQCRKMAAAVEKCFGTNCDSLMSTWFTAQGITQMCRDRSQLAQACQEGDVGAEELCYMAVGASSRLTTCALEFIFYASLALLLCL